jgi:formylglycine-generating enzyme
MKKVIVLILFSACFNIPILQAQQPCNDFNCMLSKAKKELNGKQFKLALNSARGAKNYPNANASEADALIDKIFDAIENQRKIAEDAEKKAKTEALNARKAQENTDRLLTELRATAQQTVSLLLKEIDRNVLQLEYDSAFYKCELAINLKEQRAEVEKHILELAYFYTEADTFSAAIKMLNLLKNTGLSETSPQIRTQLQAILKEMIPPQYFTLLQSKYYPTMIEVEGAEFTMGGDSTKEKPKHQVKLNSFKMAESEITFWQYSVFSKSDKREHLPPSWGIWGDNPVSNVSWFNATDYTEWLSKKTNQKYRLPTEAEWEFAAKGGKNHSTFQYSGSDNLDEIAWYMYRDKDNENLGNSIERTHPVKTKKPNSMGLYDMTGNVWEWCLDKFDAKYFQECLQSGIADNPKGSSKGDTNIVRGGGAYHSTPTHFRLTYRGSLKPEEGFDIYGFRVIQEVKKTE